MQKKYIFLVIAIIFVVIFVVGSLFSEQKIDIAGCQAKWSLAPVTVQRSDVCDADSCTAPPELQQYNAVVDALLCACDRAKSEGYANETTNSRISSVVSNFFGYDIDAGELCNEPASYLTKRSY